MAQSVIDAQFDALTTCCQNSDVSPEYEIDSAEDKDFGKLYRVWNNHCFLGTFYQSLDGKWIAQPVNARVDGRFNTSTQVILVIIAIYENPKLQQAA